jgi:hypothetical protein
MQHLTVVVTNSGVITGVIHNIDTEKKLRQILDDHLNFPDLDDELLLIDHHHEDHTVCDFRLDPRVDAGDQLCLRRPNLTGFEAFDHAGFCPDDE